MKILALTLLFLTALAFRPGHSSAAASAAASAAGSGAGSGATSTSTSSQTERFRVPEGTSALAGVAVLALSCQEKTWQEFATWSRRKDWSGRQLPRALELSRQGQTLTIDSEHIQLNVTTSGQVHLHSAQADLTAIDGCDLLNQFEKTMAGRKIQASAASRLLFLDVAGADELVRESNITDDSVIGASLAVGVGAGILMSLFPPTSLLGIALVSSTILDIATGVVASYRNITTKDELVSALNSDFKLQCNGAAMQLTYASGVILVRKVAGVAQVEIHPNNHLKEMALADSSVAPRSQKKLIEMAQECNSAEDARKILSAVKKIREAATRRVTALNSSPSPSAEKPSVTN